MSDKKKIGRPSIPIDIKKVAYELECGCSGASIAESMGIHADTLERFILRETGMNLTAFASKNKQRGNNNIHRMQYEESLKEGKEGTTMRIWLGKQRLGQSEKSENKNETSETITVTIKDLSGTNS